jgi:hypothetical protein
MKIKRIDPNSGSGSNELLILNIKTKDLILEVVIREDTNIQHINELICLFGDFRTYPKKFKEIF